MRNLTVWMVFFMVLFATFPACSGKVTEYEITLIANKPYEIDGTNVKIEYAGKVGNAPSFNRIIRDSALTSSTRCFTPSITGRTYLAEKGIQWVITIKCYMEIIEYDEDRATIRIIEVRVK